MIGLHSVPEGKGLPEGLDVAPCEYREVQKYPSKISCKNFCEKVLSQGDPPGACVMGDKHCSRACVIGGKPAPGYCDVEDEDCNKCNGCKPRCTPMKDSPEQCTAHDRMLVNMIKAVAGSCTDAMLPATARVQARSGGLIQLCEGAESPQACRSFY